jgi:pseudouridine-5'-phosphate glycosidase
MLNSVRSNKIVRAHCCRGKGVRKTSRRDMAFVMAKGLTGATTVSATMLLAARAGIHVFVTGGRQHPLSLI